MTAGFLINHRCLGHGLHNDTPTELQETTASAAAGDIAMLDLKITNERSVRSFRTNGAARFYCFGMSEESRE